jgi:kynureninase
MTLPLSFEECQRLDATDPLRTLRDAFDLPPETIYLDGNSLGARPKATTERLQHVLQHEWGHELIRAWNTAGWFDLPQRLGDQIAPLIGADAGEVVVTDTTSVNLYKVLFAALEAVAATDSARRVVVSERSNFPTDLYIAQSLCQARGLVLRLIEPEELDAALTPDVAVLLLTHVNYRTGAMHDMAGVTATAHAQGIRVIWDLAHSAGAVPVDLHAAQADYAVGCGYKYLNGGPGAPAFVWVNPAHASAFAQPLAGWWGHAAPFAFTPDYRPAPGVARYLCGTQPILSLAALGCGLEVFTQAQALGGMDALRQKSLALTDLFIRLVETRCAGHGLTLVTPRAHAQRGSQVCLSRASGAYAIVQALIARRVIGDFRAGDSAAHPDILRFGFTPLYLGYAEVWQAVEHLHQVLEQQEWQHPQFAQQHAVT